METVGEPPGQAQFLPRWAPDQRRPGAGVLGRTGADGPRSRAKRVSVGRSNRRGSRTEPSAGISIADPGTARAKLVSIATTRRPRYRVITRSPTATTSCRPAKPAVPLPGGHGRMPCAPTPYDRALMRCRPGFPHPGFHHQRHRQRCRILHHPPRQPGQRLGFRLRCLEQQFVVHL